MHERRNGGPVDPDQRHLVPHRRCRRRSSIENDNGQRRIAHGLRDSVTEGLDGVLRMCGERGFSHRGATSGPMRMLSRTPSDGTMGAASRRTLSPAASRTTSTLRL
jgi:hypothetical protein